MRTSSPKVKDSPLTLFHFVTQTKDKYPPRLVSFKLLLKMCYYISLSFLCEHHTLLAGSNCYLLYAQLARANDPAELARHALPFEMPDACLPSRWNVQRRYMQDYCSWECRNNAVEGRGLGAEGALFLVPRPALAGDQKLHPASIPRSHGQLRHCLQRRKHPNHTPWLQSRQEQCQSDRL